jgi:putative sterol carrier protein
MASLLRELYNNLPARFQPDQARDLNAVIQLNVLDSPDDCAYIMVGPEECAVCEGDYPDPDAVILCGADDLRSLFSGRISAIELFSEGRMTIRGSVAQAARVYSLLHHSRIS